MESSRHFGSLQQSKNMLLSFIDESELAPGKNVSVCVIVGSCNGLATCPGSSQGIPNSSRDSNHKRDLVGSEDGMDVDMS